MWQPGFGSQNLGAGIWKPGSGSQDLVAKVGKSIGYYKKNNIWEKHNEFRIDL